MKTASESADRVITIGRSVLGKNILAFVKGHGPARALIHGAIHAREYITARLVAELIQTYRGEAEIWFVPLVNPDGARLVLEGLSSVPLGRRARLKELNNSEEDFSLWKANINGVDLNVNFDAQWGRGESNIAYSAPENFIGPYPFSEPETRALRDLTVSKNFIASISYHTKGREIYWGFDGNYNYQQEAEAFSRLTKYPLMKSEGSAGGYKDWFTLISGGLGLTIEAGADEAEHPLDDDDYSEIWEENKYVAELLSETAIGLIKEKN